MIHVIRVNKKVQELIEKQFNIISSETSTATEKETALRILETVSKSIDVTI